MKKNKLTHAIAALVFFATILFGIFLPNQANATAVTGFNAGNIIDDSIFTNSRAMSIAQIQSFLNSKVPNCDTNGTKTSEYGGGTRAQYGRSQGYPPPYTCLRNYNQGGKTAAQIIYQAAQDYSINPQVLIVLLQKEQGLVTDNWPWSVQYRSATGYACPDSAACNSDYYGFTNQVRNAAKMFHNIIIQNPNWYSPYSLGVNHIYWNPNLGNFVNGSGNAVSGRNGCGYTNVNIQNLSTVALYSYTPYQPNQAALNAGYGKGNSCSSYGNRNFYEYFTDWFGLTHAKCTSSSKMGSSVYRLFSTKYARHYYTAFQCEALYLDATTTYHLEGVAFYQAPTTANLRTGIFRLINTHTNERFWTSSERERDNLMHHGFKFEGTVFIGLKNESTSPKSPVFRLYNRVTGSHLWTTSTNERDHSSGAWRYEGVAFYTYSQAW